MVGSSPDREPLPKYFPLAGRIAEFWRIANVTKRASENAFPLNKLRRFQAPATQVFTPESDFTTAARARLVHPKSVLTFPFSFTSSRISFAATVYGFEIVQYVIPLDTGVYSLGFGGEDRRNVLLRPDSLRFCAHREL